MVLYISNRHQPRCKSTGGQHHHRAAEVFDGRLEGVAPPVEVQVNVRLRMLVHAEDIEPDYDIRLGAEVVPQRIHHIEEWILPSM